MERNLEQGDATQQARNQFRLRRPSGAADFELRVADWRVFYRVGRDQVLVVMIGPKRGQSLFVDDRRFAL